MDADRRQALVRQGKALKQRLTDMEVRLQEVENQLQVRICLSNSTTLYYALTSKHWGATGGEAAAGRKHLSCSPPHPSRPAC